jgi:thymidylate kinase
MKVKMVRKKTLKIVVEGCCGSGKSTFIAQLKELLEITYRLRIISLHSATYDNLYKNISSISSSNYHKLFSHIIAHNKMEEDFLKHNHKYDYEVFDIVFLDRSIFCSGIIYQGWLENDSSVTTILQAVSKESTFADIDFFFMMVEHPDELEMRHRKSMKNKKISFKRILESQNCYIEFMRNHVDAMFTVKYDVEFLCDSEFSTVLRVAKNIVDALTSYSKFDDL